MKFKAEDFWGVKQQPEIGDGGYPNKYWVAYCNDYVICTDDGFPEYASEIIPNFKPYGKTIGPFETYQEALKKFNELEIAYISYKEIPSKSDVTSVYIEDRLTGVIAECYVEFYNREYNVLRHNTLCFRGSYVAKDS